MLKEEALEYAKEQRMDIVVVDHNSTPPTCRLWPQQTGKAKRAVAQKQRVLKEKEVRHVAVSCCVVVCIGSGN